MSGLFAASTVVSWLSVQLYVIYIATNLQITVQLEHTQRAVLAK